MKNAFKDRQNRFKLECKVINLKYEYENFQGEEKWAIVTGLTEAQLVESYSDIIDEYTPFVVLSLNQWNVFAEYKRNEHKYEMRRKRREGQYSIEELYDCVLSECCDQSGTFEQREEELERECERIKEIHKVKSVLDRLKPVQRERLIKNKIKNMSSRQIAKDEGVNYSSVDKSIKVAVRNFIKFYEEF